MKRFWTYLIVIALQCWASAAWAMPPSPDGQKQGPNFLFPVILSFFVIYFLILRPQQRQERDRQKQLQAIEKGDEIVTKGGLVGKVTNTSEKVVTIEIADRTRVKIDRNFVHSIQKPDPKSAA